MLELVNPATGRVFEKLEPTPISDLNEMFGRAQTAQKKWKKSSYEDRKKVFEGFCEGLLDQAEPLAKILSQEMGKPLSQALGEIRSTVPRVKWFMENFEKCLESQTVFEEGEMTERISWDPLGVVLNISAWNFPYFVGSNVFVPALLTGNSVIYKPSEVCSLTGLKIRELLLESGLGPDLFQTVIGEGSVGQTLLEYPVDGVFFTGSNRTGIRISQELAGRTTIKVNMELGGKDPAYICEDAAIDETVDTLVDGVFYNAGQSCCSVERIYVHKDVYERFLEQFCLKVSSLVMGDPMSEGTYLGPLARKEQLAFLEEQKRDALEKGATELVKGGLVEEGEGCFYKPSVFLNVDHTMSLMRDESFGPVVGIMKVKNDEEAVVLMNDTDFGLTASVHTRDQERGEKILSQLDVGTVYLNGCDRVSPRVPWSGRRNSGIGSTLSCVGIKEFLKPRAWQMMA